MTNVTPLPTRLHVAEQSPAGRHGFEEPTPDHIEITAGVSKVYAVRVDGIIWSEFSTASNAIRCASLLGELERLGALTPTNVVRHMLAKSVEAAS